MFCNKCGTENADDAVYCKSCGSRLDGKLFCPSCGKEIESDSAFCGYCGKKISGARAKADAAQTAEAAVSAVKPVDANKILKTVASVAVLVTAALSLIFVFCIGVTATMTEGNGSMSESFFLYDYFGEAYKDLKEALSAAETGTKGSEYFSMTLYTPVVLGTIVSAVTLVFVLIFSVLGIVMSINSLLGKSEKNGATYAVSAYFAYVVGASLLLAFNNFKISFQYESLTGGFNAPTIAGLVLGAVSVAVYAGCAAASQGRKLLNAGVIIKLVFALVLTALAGVITGLLPTPTYGMKLENVKLGGMISVGITSVISAMGIMCPNSGAYTRVKNADAVFALELVALLVLVALMIIAACILVRTITGTGESDRARAPLGLSVVMLVLSVLFMTFTVVGAQEFVKAAETVGGATVAGESVKNFSLTYEIPIVVLVLSALSLGVSIVQTVLNKKFTEKAEIAAA